MATKPAAGEYYIVSVANTARVIDIAGGNMSDGANVTIYTLNRTDAQRFVVSYRSNGSLQLTNHLNGKSLDIANGNLRAGANVQMWTDNDSRAQEWDLKDYDTTVTINNKSYDVWGVHIKDTNLYLDLAGGATSAGTNVQIYTGNDTAAQKWVFMPIEVFRSGGLYEIRSMLKTSMALDIANGAVYDGGNVQIYSANGSNAQKFVLTDEGDGWSIRAVGAGKYVDVAGGTMKSETNVQTFTQNNTRAQRWRVNQYNTVEISNKTCQIVSFGAGNQDTYRMDVTWGSAALSTNVWIYTANNNTNAQMFALYPTSAEDPNMPSPYNMGLAEAVGGTVSKFLAVTGASKRVSKNVIPSWCCAESWSTKGSNSFQWRYRIATMDPVKSLWSDWSGYKIGWSTARVTVNGVRFDVTEGINVNYQLENITANVPVAKSFKISIEVRSCGVEELNLLRGTPVVETFEVCYKPTMTISNPKLMFEGIQFDYTTDYTVGPINIIVQSLLDGSNELLSQECKIVLLDERSKLIIPMSYLASLPNPGDSLTLSYSIGTDRYDRFPGTITVKNLTFSYDTYTPLSITYSEGEAFTLTATVNDVGNVRMWVVLDDIMVECDRLDSQQQGTVSFMVPYPFGTSYKIMATGYSSNVWYLGMDSKTGDDVALHAWNADGVACVLQCREDEVLATEFDIESTNESFELNSRSWEAVRFGTVRKGKFTVEGAVVPGKTASTYRAFERLVGRHALFRSVTGDISRVGVMSVKRTSKTSHTTLTVTMTKEDF